MENRSLSTRAVLETLLLSLIWGATFTFIKIGLRDSTTLFYLGLRYLLAAIALYAYLRHMRAPLSMPRGQVFLFGLSMIVYAALVLFHYYGLGITGAGRGSVISNGAPLFVVLFASFSLGERITRGKVLGVALALLGIYVTFRDNLAYDSGGVLLGDLFILTGTILWAWYSILLKKLGRMIRIETLIFWQSVLLIPPFFLLSLATESSRVHFSAGFVISLAYTSVISQAFAMVLFTRLVRDHDVSRISILMFVQPLFGVLIAVALLGEAITRNVLWGAALVAAALYVANRRPRRRMARGG